MHHDKRFLFLTHCLEHTHLTYLDVYVYIINFSAFPPGQAEALSLSEVFLGPVTTFLLFHIMCCAHEVRSQQFSMVTLRTILFFNLCSVSSLCVSN